MITVENNTYDFLLWVYLISMFGKRESVTNFQVLLPVALFKTKTHVNSLKQAFMHIMRRQPPHAITPWDIVSRNAVRTFWLLVKKRG